MGPLGAACGRMGLHGAAWEAGGQDRGGWRLRLMQAMRVFICFWVVNHGVAGSGVGGSKVCRGCVL